MSHLERFARIAARKPMHPISAVIYTYPLKAWRRIRVVSPPASSIPETGRVSLFRQGDTLVSNIRPYFKKIWHADQNGYCSNDILVFEPNDASISDYLYWLLSGDQFFDYVMATSKGTKMPRGDKSAIMNYAVPSNDETARRMIVSIMNPIQSKIEANTKLNGYLAA